MVDYSYWLPMAKVCLMRSALSISKSTLCLQLLLMFILPQKTGSMLQTSRILSQFKKTLHEIVFDFSKITYIFARFSYHFKQSGVCSLIEKKVWSKKYKFDFIKSLKTRCHIIELIFKAKQIDNGVIQPSTLYKPRIHKCLICYQLWYNFFLRSIVMKEMISSHCGWHFRPKILQRIILQYANKFLIQTNICIAQHIVLLYTVCALMLYNFKGWMQALGPKSLYIVNIFLFGILNSISVTLVILFFLWVAHQIE